MDGAPNLVSPPKASEPDPLHPQAAALWRSQRQHTCTACDLHRTARVVCLYGDGPVPSAGMVVLSTVSPQDDAAGRLMRSLAGEYLRLALREHDLDPLDLYVTAAVKCVPPSENREKVLPAAMKVCAPTYLRQELARVQPRAVLALGAQAYHAFTHQPTGITTKRGQVLHLSGLPRVKGRSKAEQAELDARYPSAATEATFAVVPTLDPSYVLSNPHYDEAFQSDVAKFARLVRGGSEDGPGVELVEIRTLDGWRAALTELRAAGGVLTFDVETRGFVDARAAFARMWCLSLCAGTRNEAGDVRVFGLPLEHPDSPFITWADDGGVVIGEDLRVIVAEVVELVLASRVNGANVHFDLRHLVRMAQRYGVGTGRFQVGDL